MLHSPEDAESRQGVLGLRGQWEIREEDKTYVATLDEEGNGSYTWKNGRMHTTSFKEGLWGGTWHQTGNDREGGFEVFLSKDGKQAAGVWWYTRVGEHENIPPREWGGPYTWTRLDTKTVKDTKPVQPSQKKEEP